MRSHLGLDATGELSVTPLLFAGKWLLTWPAEASERPAPVDAGRLAAPGAGQATKASG
jgi:hypothetical protein